MRVLVRASSPRTNLTWTDVEVAEGDMRDPAAVVTAMAGMRYLVHAAADYRLWAPDPEEMVRTNRDGTRVLMQAALAAGVERIVYTSSVATIRPHDDGTPADETRPLTPRPPSAPTSAARSWPSAWSRRWSPATGSRR